LDLRLIVFYYFLSSVAVFYAVLLGIYDYLMTYFADKKTRSVHIYFATHGMHLYDFMDPLTTFQPTMAFCMHSGVVALSQLAFGATSNWAGNATL